MKKRKEDVVFIYVRYNKIVNIKKFVGKFGVAKIWHL